MRMIFGKFGEYAFKDERNDIENHSSGVKCFFTTSLLITILPYMNFSLWLYIEMIDLDSLRVST
jgi:hypothetical protein